jgi:hypothetical protein
MSLDVQLELFGAIYRLVDRERLCQLANLMSNAVKFTPKKGGTIVRRVFSGAGTASHEYSRCRRGNKSHRASSNLRYLFQGEGSGEVASEDSAPAQWC